MTDKSDPLVILETDRLILRRQQTADVSFLVDLWSDPEATRYLSGPRDRSFLLAEFEKTAAHPTAEVYDLWPVVEKESNHLVGHSGLLDKDIEGKTEIELNYIFSPSVWGRGYATEMGRAIRRWARETMGLSRLIALIEPDNLASQRVAVKVGMHLEKEIIRPGGARKKLFLVEDETPVHR